jgi:hypothetical protein
VTIRRDAPVRDGREAASGRGRRQIQRWNQTSETVN